MTVCWTCIRFHHVLDNISIPFAFLSIIHYYYFILHSDININNNNINSSSSNNNNDDTWWQLGSVDDILEWVTLSRFVFAWPTFFFIFLPYTSFVLPFKTLSTYFLILFCTKSSLSNLSIGLIRQPNGAIWTSAAEVSFTDLVKLNLVNLDRL